MAAFPRLSPTTFALTSPSTGLYNCIAWAADDTTRWWWPVHPRVGYYWPPEARRVLTVEAFVEAFQTLGYEVCDSDKPEPGWEKVAIFASNDVPTHAARQLETGRWTSKLGPEEDIQHTLHGLQGGYYGDVVLVMKRRRQVDTA